MTQPSTMAVVVQRRPPRSRSRLWLRSPVAVVSASLVVILVLLVVFADVLAPIDPEFVDLSSVLQGPSAQHPLGTDAVGRDVWSRLLHGGRLTLLGAAVVLAVCVTLGTVGGLLAGYYRGHIEAVGIWIAALLMALPSLVVLLAVRTSLGGSVILLMVVFGVLISPMIFHLVRTTVREVVAEPYIEAAKTAGLSDGRIVARHVLSAIRAPLIIQSMMVAGLSIGVLAVLDFLGIGSEGVTWGGMLSDAFEAVFSAPQLLFWPALFIGAMASSLILLGNALRDNLDARTPIVPRRPRPPITPPAPGPPTIESAAASDTDDRRGSEPLLEVRDVAIGYDLRDGGSVLVVDGASLSIARQEILGLVGESGSGKSQIAFSILGLLPEEARIERGSVRFRGEELIGRTDEHMRRARLGGIAYVPQEPMSNLDPSYTVGFQLTEPLRFGLGMSRLAARSRILELLTAVRIADPARVMDAYPHEISGGMAQRVLIAGALSLDPVLLVADEPTTALDVTVQDEVLRLLRDLRDERGVAILLVTHDLGVVADACDRMVVLRQGKVVEEGDVFDVFRNPREEYTRTLLGSTLVGAPAREPWTRPVDRSDR